MADADCSRRRRRSARGAGMVGRLLKNSLVSVGVGLLLNGPVAHAQNAWQTIRQRHSLTISTDATYPPFEFMDKGKLVGFDKELGDEIGKQLGVTVVWLPLEWTAVQGSLESRKADLIMSGMTITAERKQKGYTFSRPYFVSGQAIARRRGDAGINTVADLRDKTASVQDQTTGMTALQKAGLPSNQIIKFDTLQDGLMDVRNNKSSAAVADVPALTYILHTAFPDLEMVGVGTFPPEYLGVAAPRDETELAAHLNQALDTLFVNGAYARIYARWMAQPLSTSLIAQLDKARAEGSTIPDDIAARVAKEGVSGGGNADEERRRGDKETTGVSSASTLSIRWGLLRESLPLLLTGARFTLEITLLTLLFGVTGGLVVALARLSPFAPLRALVTLYVELVRGTPLLMQIYFIYFVLPALHVSFSPLLSGAVALSLNAAAYISEIFRGGIESIDTGQMEAARALGLDYPAAMRYVILPQTVRRVLPPLTNEAVALLKDSSLVSVVGVTELMRQGKEIAANTGSATTLYLGVAALYLCMTLPLTTLVRRLERQWQPRSGKEGRSVMVGGGATGTQEEGQDNG